MELEYTMKKTLELGGRRYESMEGGKVHVLVTVHKSKDFLPWLELMM